MSRSEKRKLWLISLYICITATLEAFTIGAVFPLFSKLLDPEKTVTSNYDLTFFLPKNLDPATSGQLIVLIIALLLTTGLLLKFLLNVVITYSSTMWIADLSSKALMALTDAKYSWLTKFDKSEAQTIILHEVNNLVGGVLMPGLKLFSAFLLSTWLILIAFWINFYLTSIILLALVILGLFFSVGLRRILIELSTQKVKANATRMNQTEEILTGIKIFKLLADKPSLVDAFIKSSRSYSNSIAKGIIISTIPKFTIELTLIFGGLVFIIFKNQIFLGSDAHFMTTLATFAVIGSRLYPNFQLLYSVYSIMLSNFGSVGKVSSFVSDAHANRETYKSGSGTKIVHIESIKLENLITSYQSVPANKFPVNMVISKGEHLVLTGPSGSGKTSTIDAIIGFSNIVTGKILINNQPLDQIHMGSFRSKVSYVTQTPHIVKGSLVDNITLGQEIKDLTLVTEALIAAGLLEFVSQDGQPSIREMKISEGGANLSGGQKQRLAIARALYGEAELLILDEITSSLAEENESTILATIKDIQANLTIISISHKHAYIKSADEVLVLR